MSLTYLWWSSVSFKFNFLSGKLFISFELYSSCDDWVVKLSFLIELLIMFLNERESSWFKLSNILSFSEVLQIYEFSNKILSLFSSMWVLRGWSSCLPVLSISFESLLICWSCYFNDLESILLLWLMPSLPLVFSKSVPADFMIKLS